MWLAAIVNGEPVCIYDKTRCMPIGEVLDPREIAEILRDAEGKGQKVLYCVSKALDSFNFFQTGWATPNNKSALKLVRTALKEK